MSEGMSEVVVAPSAAGTASESFEVLANLNEGILGTGYSTLVELSFVTMVLIVGYVAHGTFRYFLPDFSITRVVADTLGFRD